MQIGLQELLWAWPSNCVPAGTVIYSGDRLFHGSHMQHTAGSSAVNRDPSVMPGMAVRHMDTQTVATMSWCLLFNGVPSISLSRQICWLWT
jgi:hypothetical protein